MVEPLTDCPFQRISVSNNLSVHMRADGGYGCSLIIKYVHGTSHVL